MIRSTIRAGAFVGRIPGTMGMGQRDVGLWRRPDFASSEVQTLANF